MNDVIGMYSADPNVELQTVINYNNPMLLGVLLDNNVDKLKALDPTIAKKNAMMIDKVIESGATASSAHVALVTSMGDNMLFQKLVDMAHGDLSAGIYSAITAGKSRRYYSRDVFVQGGNRETNLSK